MRLTVGIQGAGIKHAAGGVVAAQGAVDKHALVHVRARIQVAVASMPFGRALQKPVFPGPDTGHPFAALCAGSIR